MQPKIIKTDEQFGQASLRRLALIQKECEGGGLTSRESKELNQLQAACLAFVNRDQPMIFPPLRGAGQLTAKMAAEQKVGPNRAKLLQP